VGGKTSHDRKKRGTQKKANHRKAHAKSFDWGGGGRRREKEKGNKKKNPAKTKPPKERKIFTLDHPPGGTIRTTSQQKRKKKPDPKVWEPRPAHAGQRRGNGQKGNFRPRGHRTIDSSGFQKGRKIRHLAKRPPLEKREISQRKTKESRRMNWGDAARQTRRWRKKTLLVEKKKKHLGQKLSARRTLLNTFVRVPNSNPDKWGEKILKWEKRQKSKNACATRRNGCRCQGTRASKGKG